jgi:hypothetical protein
VTVSFRRRGYPEVLTSLLASATGGVAAEQHPFPPPGATGAPWRHPLERPPVASVEAVWGTRSGVAHAFRPGTDWRLLDDGQTLEWQPGAELPDPGTLLDVTYYPAAAQPVVTDVYTGSVVRTLGETFALELARVYATLEGVYRAGFIDTAEGDALDNVVALLGVERVEGGRPAGLVELTRAPGSTGAVTVPAGTRVATADGEREYETTETVTLAPGQRAIRVGARDLEKNDPLPAGALTVLPIPLAGIAEVTNPSPTAITTQSETDVELRARAKSFLHGSERATLKAMESAVARQGLRADVVDAEDDPSLAAGVVKVTPHAETLTPEMEQRLRTALRDARPAGVKVELAATRAPAKVDLSLRLDTVPGIPEAELRGVQQAVRERVERYFARLPVRENGSVGQITGLVLSIPQVRDVRVVSAVVRAGGTSVDALRRDTGVIELAGAPTVLADLQVADPALPTQVTATVLYPAASPPPDPAALRAALTAALAHLSTMNLPEPAPGAPVDPRRIVSWSKLAYAAPVPSRVGKTLAEWDAAVAGGTPPNPSPGPYELEFTLALPSGMARVLAAAADTYTPAPQERLALAGVAVEEDDGQ